MEVFLKKLNMYADCPNSNAYPEPNSGFLTRHTSKSYCIFYRKGKSSYVKGEYPQCDACYMFFDEYALS
jgi:hypothetical protein